MGAKIVSMKISARLMPKLLSSPGMGSSLLHMRFYSDVPWSRWGETARCLAHVWIPGPCGGWPCLQCASTLHPTLWQLQLLKHIWREKGQCSFYEIALSLCIFPSFSFNLIFKGNYFGSHFQSRGCF